MEIMEINSKQANYLAELIYEDIVSVLKVVTPFPEAVAIRGTASEEIIQDVVLLLDILEISVSLSNKILSQVTDEAVATALNHYSIVAETVVDSMRVFIANTVFFQEENDDS